MGKKLTESKAINIVLSVLIAVGLWAYVTNIVSDERTVPVTVTATLTGEDVLNARGLMVDPSSKLTLNLKLTGSRTALANMMTNLEENLTVSINVSSITEVGTYSLPCTITQRNAVTSGLVTVEGRNEKTVEVTVSKLMEKNVEVRASFKGTLPEGYRTNTAEISPSTIRVIGPESVVSQIQYAQVTITGEALTGTFSGELGFDYVDAQGQVVESPDLSSNTDTVSVILPVVKTLEMPLDVEIVYGGGITKENFADHVTLEIEPSTIQVSGDEADINRRQGSSITLGKIDLSTLSGTYKFPILVSSELTNDSGISEATVTVKVRGLETKTLTTNKIEIINADPAFNATAVTQSLQVKVRGPAEALTNVESYQLRVVVDLNNEPLSQGQFNFRAKVYLDGDGQCGVVSGEDDYYIVVNIQRS